MFTKFGTYGKWKVVSAEGEKANNFNHSFNIFFMFVCLGGGGELFLCQKQTSSLDIFSLVYHFSSFLSGPI